MENNYIRLYCWDCARLRTPGMKGWTQINDKHFCPKHSIKGSK